eukprot:1161444-Pelagomonas_calceolata.AAC.5
MMPLGGANTLQLHNIPSTASTMTLMQKEKLPHEGASNSPGCAQHSYPGPLQEKKSNPGQERCALHTLRERIKECILSSNQAVFDCVQQCQISHLRQQCVREMSSLRASTIFFMPLLYQHSLLNQRACMCQDPKLEKTCKAFGLLTFSNEA